MPPAFRIICTSPDAWERADFLDHVHESLQQFGRREVQDGPWAGFRDAVDYVPSTADDGDALAAAVTTARRDLGGSVRTLHYLSVPPFAFESVVGMLGAARLTEEPSRVIIEKPFGHDLESARHLNAVLHSAFAEEQIFRIDHFLGKEDVQNILAARFANGFFEPIWNRGHIDNVQIDVPETLGLEHRAGFYESTGAYRDMIVTHLLQAMGFVAMERPENLTPDELYRHKEGAFEAIVPLDPQDVVRGQYEGYRSEDGVASDSDTETFAAARVTLDNERWRGVPFYLRTGKRMAERVSEIAIQFRRPPLQLFRKTPVEHLSRNVLVIRVQPEDGIILRFGAKIPGPTLRVGNVAMDFRYKDYFGANPTTGYETLLYDCMKGDATLFQRADMAEIGWRIVQPLLDRWRETTEPPPVYRAGSWGPACADELLAKDGRKWRKIEE
jgi:glucose-6-phosphate 1-dehydrogenase